MGVRWGGVEVWDTKKEGRSGWAYEGAGVEVDEVDEKEES